MTSLIEKVARAVCFNSEYRDNHPDGPDDLTCLVCKSLAECQDWNVYSLGNERIARATIQVVLREMMEPTEEMFWAANAATSVWLNVEGSQLTVNKAKYRARYQAMLNAFAKHHNIDLT